MPGWSYLEYAVLAAAAVCLAGLFLSLARTSARGVKPKQARPAGDEGRGVVFAFGAGMLPSHKESARLHLAVYTAGIVYHLGTFATFALLLAWLARLSLPPALFDAAWWLVLAAFLCGAALLAKRVASPDLRRLSIPDDYVSNALVDFFLLSFLLAKHFSWASDLWLVSAAVLLLAIPCGKIRHCVFFFVARRQLGAFLGRRGVFPPPGPRHDRP